MRILIINGSPKGKNSITLHTCLFLEKQYTPPQSFLGVGGKMSKGMIAPYKKILI